MLICYLDESGDTAKLPTRTSNIQPLICIVGVAIDSKNIISLTKDFVALKRKFFRGKMNGTLPHLGDILIEIKGSELRNNLRSASRDVRRHTIGFFDHVFDLLESVETKLFGRVWIKAIGVKNNEVSIYTSSVQHICQAFNALLKAQSKKGAVVADSRTNQQGASRKVVAASSGVKIFGSWHVAEKPTIEGAPRDPSSPYPGAGNSHDLLETQTIPFPVLP